MSCYFLLSALIFFHDVTFSSESGSALGQDDFEKYEIRVIRPKFMTKKGRIELGGQLTAVMNQTFIYTYLATGILDYHFSDTFAIEVAGAYGFSLDKEDKRTLEDEFDIQTQILRTQYFANGALLWTPIYGKYQLASGRLIYFDTFLSFGGGITGIEYDYKQCRTADEDATGPNEVTDPPAPTTYSYPTGVIGIGQKFFISKSWGLRWDARDNIFLYNSAHGSCVPDDPNGESKVQQNITLQIGAVTFF